MRIYAVADLSGQERSALFSGQREIHQRSTTLLSFLFVLKSFEQPRMVSHDGACNGDFVTSNYSQSVAIIGFFAVSDHKLSRNSTQHFALSVGSPLHYFVSKRWWDSLPALYPITNRFENLAYDSFMPASSITAFSFSEAGRSGIGSFKGRYR